MLKSDEALRRAQVKVLCVPGPLLKLHKDLDKIRKGKRVNKFKLEKVSPHLEITYEAVCIILCYGCFEYSFRGRLSAAGGYVMSEMHNK